MLSTLAGFVDALAYLALYHIYVANMSGNTVAAGVDLATRQWREGIHRLVPVAAFVLGLIAADLVIETARVRGVRRLLSLSLGMEAACLAGFLVLGLHQLGGGPAVSASYSPRAAMLVALAALGMGAQNVSLRAVAGLHVYTTHVTGTLTALGRRFVLAIVAGRHAPGGQSRRRLLLLLWVVYFLGAAAGGWSWTKWGLWPMLAPLAALLAVIAIDLSDPIGTRR